MKGVILAGGRGTRLLPATKITNKHLIPILNKPMIEYPLETLIKLGCKEILVVTGGDHIGDIASYLGDGSDYGVELTYRVQKEAGGIGQAIGLAKGFANGERIAVILGDNIFNNNFIDDDFLKLIDDDNAHLFVKSVFDPSRFGVLYIDPDTGIHRIVEKPKEPESDKAVTGLYIYPSEVFDVIPALKPSDRGELEVTDINNHFIKRNLCVGHDLDGKMGAEAFWSDAGTPKSLHEVINWAFNKKD